MPKRWQLSRRKGAKIPEAVINVARPSKWGNPFKVGDPKNAKERARVVEQYEAWLTTTRAGKEILKAAKVELAGKDLACWCAAGTACHADVLLRLCNRKMITMLHTAVSVDIDRFSDAVLQRDWLPMFTANDQLVSVQGLRDACADMRARGFAVFPNADCTKRRKDGTCAGHRRYAQD